MEKFKQIPFDFSVPQTEQSKEEAGIGIRLKTMKPVPEEEPEIREVDFSFLPVLEENKPTIQVKNTRGRKSVKDNAADAELIDIPPDDLLFSKQYYAIGEVAGMFRVNTSLLRFWEGEFPQLKPKKNKKGDRFFRPQDIKTLLLIHDLLRRRKMTIEGARDFLNQQKQVSEKFELIRSLKEIKHFFLEIKANL